MLSFVSVGSRDAGTRRTPALEDEQTVPTHMVDQMLGQLVHIGKAYGERGDWEIAARKLRFVGKLIPQQVCVGGRCGGWVGQ